MVADRQVLPVGRERLAARPEQPPDVGRVVLAGVEVDVVAHLERQVQPHAGQRVQRGFDDARDTAVGQQFGDPGPDFASTGPGPAP